MNSLGVDRPSAEDSEVSKVVGTWLRESPFPVEVGVFDFEVGPTDEDDRFSLKKNGGYGAKNGSIPLR